MEASPDDEAPRRAAQEDLDDLYVIVQLFSYPGDYVAERPSPERLAETLEKFEEDVLQADRAGVRAPRRALVEFGEPVPVDGSGRQRDATQALTRILEREVQSRLDGSRVDAPFRRVRRLAAGSLRG